MDVPKYSGNVVKLLTAVTLPASRWQCIKIGHRMFYQSTSGSVTLVANMSASKLPFAALTLKQVRL